MLGVVTNLKMSNGQMHLISPSSPRFKADDPDICLSSKWWFQDPGSFCCVSLTIATLVSIKLIDHGCKDLVAMDGNGVYLYIFLGLNHWGTPI